LLRSELDYVYWHKEVLLRIRKRKGERGREREREEREEGGKEGKGEREGEGERGRIDIIVNWYYINIYFLWYENYMKHYHNYMECMRVRACVCLFIDIYLSSHLTS